jgi:ligand-binding sensor domain-containing protein
LSHSLIGARANESPGPEISLKNQYLKMEQRLNFDRNVRKLDSALKGEEVKLHHTLFDAVAEDVLNQKMRLLNSRRVRARHVQQNIGDLRKLPAARARE